MKHKHHIIPKHIGGTDDPSNIIEVSVEEHAQLHLDLYLTYGRWQDWLAFHAIAGIIECEDVVAEALAMGGRMSGGNKHFTEETGRKISESKRGKPRSQAVKDAIRKYNIENNTFQRAADANKKPLEFMGVVYESITACHKATGKHQRTIKKHCKFLTK